LINQSKIEVRMAHVRDDEEFEKKRQQIMEAALVVFAEKGYAKATNRDIARAAGIGSAGLIYHYFEDKADLLRQAVAEQVPAMRSIENEETLAGLPPREALTLAASAFLSSMTDARVVALFRVMLGEALRIPDVGVAWSHAVPGPGFIALRRYLAGQIAAGTLRPMDVGAATRCFIGPLFLYLLTHEVIPVPDSQTLEVATMVQAVVDVFLQGTLVGPDGREPGPIAGPRAATPNA
jgi:TetR/AcrR family transcriptional regulator, mexJK operon transcriptional repressor